jgi:BASS family bile acid:Na+ symporter
MSSGLITIGLPIALAIIMFGLGLSLTPGDFRRVARTPRAVAVALGLQVFVLPVIAFGLCIAFDLDPLLAVGVMLLAASPGGTTANLFSHLFRGDVALNITLTAVNSLIAIATLPAIINLGLRYFEPTVGGEDVTLPLTKVLEVFAIVLVPVLLGMLVRRKFPELAALADRPVRILSAVVLAAVIAGAILSERDNIGEYLADVGLAALLFCAVSLAVGYLVPRAFGVDRRQATACAMEIGIHNSTLAITVAISVLDSVDLAIPAAVYSIVMFPAAALAGWLISRRRAAVDPTDASTSA